MSSTVNYTLAFVPPLLLLVSGSSLWKTEHKVTDQARTIEPINKRQMQKHSDLFNIFHYYKCWKSVREMGERGFVCLQKHTDLVCHWSKKRLTNKNCFYLKLTSLCFSLMLFLNALKKKLTLSF